MSTASLPRQADHAAVGSVLPEDVDWKSLPEGFPSVKLAVVAGLPSRPGPYVIRLQVSAGVKLMPRRHPEDRIYTVISGVCHIGLGAHADDDAAEAYPPGSVIVLPANTPHFHWAKCGEYVVQETVMGPLSVGGTSH